MLDFFPKKLSCYIVTISIYFYDFLSKFPLRYPHFYDFEALEIIFHLIHKSKIFCHVFLLFVEVDRVLSIISIKKIIPC